MSVKDQKDKKPAPVPEAVLATFGSWQDERSAEEIIEDIYASRTVAGEHSL